MLQKIRLNRKILLSIILVELVIWMVSGFLYSRRETVDLNFTQEDLVSDLGEKMFYVDKTYSHSYVATPAFTLPRGMYTLEVEYECQGDVRVEACYIEGSFANDVGGSIYVPGSKNALTCDFRITYGDRPLHIKGRLSGDAAEGDYILIRNVRIRTASIGVRHFVFEIGIFFLLLDCLLAVYVWKDRIFEKEQKQFDVKILLLLIILCSLPLTVNYLFGNAHDLKFHLTRIEGIKDGLQNGVFPVKIQSNWLGGHGYAVSVFYGDVLLYIPAILRFFGISIQASYNFYVLFIHTLTVWIAYHCFTKMSDRKTGLLCTIVYSFNIFRLYDIYTRAAVGEYTAMTFMPLVMYGLWKVYKLPAESKEHGRSWITITIGCLGIFLSHMISTEMTALFVILTALILWKKTFDKKNFMVLLKAVVATVLLSLWFLVPFLDYMMSGTYAINAPDRYEPYRLEDKGGFPVQLFMTDYSVMGTSGGIATRGVADNMPYTIGLASILILIAWFLFCAGKKERSKSERKEEYLAVLLCVLSLWLTMCFFPYTWLVSKIPILKFPVHGLQFSWRFFAISSVLFLWLLCIVMCKKQIDSTKKKLFAGLLALLTIWQGLSFISEFMNEASVYHIYQEGGLSSFDVVFGEYIPANDEGEFHVSEYIEGYVDELSYDADAVCVEEWHREKGTVTVCVKNLSDGIRQVEVPLILYKGYRAFTDEGEELQIAPGAFHRISVSIPAGFMGNIRVGFYEPWYWRICELVSFITLLGIVFHEVFVRQRRYKKV